MGVVLLLGCAPSEAPAPKAAPQPPVITTNAAPASAAPAAPASATSVEAHDIGPARGVLIQSDFNRYKAIEPPAALGTTLLALRPAALKYKTVAWKLQREMLLSAHAPGERLEMLRFVTLYAGQTLQAALVDRLRATGWLGPKAGWTHKIVHPTKGTLTLSVKVRSERATVVELQRTVASGTAPLERAETLIARPAWLEAWPVTPAGYEVARWHDRPRHDGPTDLERMAVYLPSHDPAGLQAQFEAKLTATGHDKRALERWHKGSGFVAFAVRPKGLVVAHQNYFYSVQPATKTPGAKPKPGAPKTQ
jgi:hypothetical protein